MKKANSLQVGKSYLADVGFNGLAPADFMYASEGLNDNKILYGNKNMIFTLGNGEQFAVSQYDFIEGNVKFYEQLKKNVVPDYIARWYEAVKNDLNKTIVGLKNSSCKEVYNWFIENENSLEIIMNMKNGYEVEDLYYVKIYDQKNGYLNEHIVSSTFAVSTKENNSTYRTKFTKERIKEINPKLLDLIVKVEVEDKK